jgi:hypothetical protein
MDRSAAPAPPPLVAVDTDRGLAGKPIALHPSVARESTGPVTSRRPLAAWSWSGPPTGASALVAWAPTLQPAIDGNHSSHHAVPRDLEGRAHPGSGTAGATSGSASGALAGGSGAPILALLFALALVAAGCWSRLVMLVRRYCAGVFLSPAERPG